MSQFILVTVSLLIVTTFAHAQEARQFRFLAHGFVGAGGPASSSGEGATAQAGVGGDVLLYRGLGAGTEVAYFREGVAALSTNGIYRFTTRSPKVTPFAAAGYTRAFGDYTMTSNWANFGGGLDWWVRDRVGVRLEFRDYVFGGQVSDQLLLYRIGLVIR